MDEDPVHFAVILPRIESVLSFAEISIFSQPVLKSYFRFRDELPWRHIPHILKSLSFSNVAGKVNKIDRHTFYLQCILLNFSNKLLH